MKSRASQSGFSLIEVMITLLVLAFGLLGLGLLQTMNLRYTQSANKRTQAVNLANELLDMMRSNRSEITNYAMPETALKDLDLTKCGMQADLGAVANIAQWKCDVRQTLGPDAKVQVDPGTGANLTTVYVIWDESLASKVKEDIGQVKVESVL